MKKNSLVLLFLLFISACITNTNKLSLIVPENSHFTITDLNHAKVKKNVQIEDKNFILLFIPLGYPNFGTMVNTLLAENHGQALINATITDRSEWYVLFGWSKVKINADVVLKN